MDAGIPIKVASQAISTAVSSSQAAGAVTQTMNVWAPYNTWQFVTACLVVAVVMTTISNMITQAAPRLMERGYFKSILTFMNLGLGILISIPKNFLYGTLWIDRMLIGLVAGGLAHIMYHALLKRISIVLGVSPSDLNGSSRKVEPMTDKPADGDKP